MYILIFLAGLIVGLTNASADTDHPAAADDRLNRLRLEPKIQQLVGVKTQILKAAPHQAEFIAYGAVLNPEPLLQLHQQYLAAQAQQDSAQAKYAESHLNLTRTEHLHHQDIISTRRLQEQQVQWQTDKASLNVSGNQQKTILAASRLNWGEILTEWFVIGHQQNADQFLNQDAQLLQISLPLNTSLGTTIKNIHVDEHGQREKAVVASLISIAPSVDPVSQGNRYFFKTTGRRLAYGAQLTAWIAADSPARSGILIPKSALVWHLGQAYIFLKTADNEFSRRQISEYKAEAQGYFISDMPEQEIEVVTTGAQTLLSEQLKTMIPDEDRD